VKRLLAVVMVLVMLLLFMAPVAMAGPADEPLWTGLRSQSLGLEEPMSRQDFVDLIHDIVWTFRRAHAHGHRVK